MVCVVNHVILVILIGHNMILLLDGDMDGMQLDVVDKNKKEFQDKKFNEYHTRIQK